MENSHLKNTINLLLRNYKSLSNSLSIWIPLDIELMWLRWESKEYIKSKMKNILSLLPFYIFEWQIRWMNFSDELYSSIWRNTSYWAPYALSLNTDDEENDNDDDDWLPF